MRLVVLLLCTLVVLPDVETETVTATVGDDATLGFRCPRDVTIAKCVWSRPDLKTDGYVFFFRDDSSNEDNLHPQFQGRVELKHKDMQDGDVSVVLRKVSVSDSGTYLCRVVTDSNKVYDHSIRLEVTEGHKRGDVEISQQNNAPSTYFGVTAGIVVGIVVIALIALIVLCVRPKLMKKSLEQPPAAEAGQ